ncbi:hypothetical protein NGM10_13360 [Halorussus salilacus]|uniref:hypothetical protein n=1 Tax=Halorussus salilacus TaxID=2953750 RepID=UPI00209DC55F|nr:hypothetical protein [Halorussus salilacus]USZ67709.1 hypothetical protein NGM10_13360 [Halorussus salilacus]
MSNATDLFDVLGNRYRDANRISDAIRKQDDLRAKSLGWSGEREVERWRNERYSY